MRRDGASPDLAEPNSLCFDLLMLYALLVAFGKRFERLLLLISGVASQLEPFKRGDYGWHGLIRVMPAIWGVLGLMYVAFILFFVALFFVAVL